MHGYVYMIVYINMYVYVKDLVTYMRQYHSSDGGFKG